MGKPYNGFIILFIILDSSMFFIIFCTVHNLAQWGSYRNWWIIPLWDLAQVKEVHLSTVSWFFLPGETWHASNVGIGKLNSFFAIFMIGTPISQKPNHGKKNMLEDYSAPSRNFFLVSSFVPRNLSSGGGSGLEWAIHIPEARCYKWSFPTGLSMNSQSQIFLKGLRKAKPSGAKYLCLFLSSVCENICD